MEVAVSGASGLVGRAVVASFRAAGHRVRRLVRRPEGARDAVFWSPDDGEVDVARLAGVEAVVHLAGESIANGRWTPPVKERIRASRVDGTRLLADALATLEPRPAVLVSASAIGIYGDRGEQAVDEDAELGSGFLADVCRAWEAAADPARAAGIRVVHPRIGVVLAAEGGVLARLLPPFRLGLGGPAGGGRQWLSWISLADLAAAIAHLVATPELAGPVDAVAPQPVRNGELGRALGRALGRPAILPLPAFALRLAFGEMADATVLASTRTAGGRLGRSGFRFRHPTIEDALAWALAAGGRS